MIARTVSGRIAYLSDKAADRGRPRGEETFTFTVATDGSVTQRAFSIIADAPHVRRDVIENADAQLRLKDCYVRIAVGKTAPFSEGAGWFRFGSEDATCEAFTSSEGRISQRHQLTGGPVVFCNHAIVGDAWMMAAYPLARGPGRVLVRDMLLPTLNKQGATGPMLAHAHLGIEYLGPERITVAAGAFDCLRFRCNSVASEDDLAEANLAYEMWCTADGLYMAVLSMYRGDRRYELTAFSAAA